MQKTRVWVRSLSDGCRVSVDAFSDAVVILDALRKSGALKGLPSVTLSVDLKDDLMPSASKCTFIVPGSDERTLATLESTLGQMAGVDLMLEPGR